MTHDDDTAMGRVVNEWLQRTNYRAVFLRDDARMIRDTGYQEIGVLLTAIATVLEAREDE